MTRPALGRVEAYLDRVLRRGPLHFTLIDPDKSPDEKAAELARGAVELGSHAILLGGSTGINPRVMAEALVAIRRVVRVPTIIFPQGTESIAPGADAILFMSLLNSRNLELVIRAHARVALRVRQSGLETIPMGYLVVAPGMRVGQVGKVDAVPRTEIDTAAGYALAAELLGMRFVYLEAGSGAPRPVPLAMVRRVRRSLTVPLIVGGGIRSGTDARNLLSAGADVLVTGTVTEEEGLGRGFRDILREVGRARSS